MWEIDKPSIVSLLFSKHNTHQPIPSFLGLTSGKKLSISHTNKNSFGLGLAAHTRWDRRWRVPDQPKLYREFPVSLGYVAPSQSNDDNDTQLWLKENWIHRYSCFFFSFHWTLFLAVSVRAQLRLSCWGWRVRLLCVSLGKCQVDYRSIVGLCLL